MRRLRLDLGYDGTDLRGWAAQPGLRTIQGEIEAAPVMASRGDVVTTVTGRTDVGVHACHQVCHTDISGAAWARLPSRGGESDEQTVASAIIRRLDRILSGCYGERVRGCDPAVVRGTYDVHIYSTAVVDPSFDTRFSAFGRSYAYRVFDRSESLGRWDRLWVEGPLDEAAMNEAGAAFLGGHDFLEFRRSREGVMTTRTLRTLLAECDAEGILAFRVEVDVFCHSMVRSLAGALLLVGSGAHDITYSMQTLRAWPRSEAASIAPAHGPTLEGVEYPNPSQWRVQAEQVRARYDTCCGDDD